MPKVDVPFGPRGELEQSNFLEFVASRPLGPQSEHAGGPPAAEDRPLHLDLATREPQRRRPGTMRPGFVGDPAIQRSSRAQRPVRGQRSRRGLLAVGLTAVVGLGLAAALWSYTALERGAIGGGDIPARPAPATSPAAPPGPVAAVQPVAEIHVAKLPDQLDAAAPAPAPALRQNRLAERKFEPKPEVAQPRRQEPDTRRPQMTSARPEASAATARANIIEAYAPQSTLSAQAAAQAQAQPAGN